MVNTAITVGGISYLYRQARIVDQVRQLLIGVEGQGGIMAEVKMLRERTHDLANKMTVLSVRLEELTRAMRGGEP